MATNNKKHNENNFLKSNKLKLCDSCGALIRKDIKICPTCKKNIISISEIHEAKGMKFLNLTDSLKHKTRHWRELMLFFAIVKLPIEVIAYFELDSFIGKLQGVGDLIFAVLFLIVSAWLVILKYVRISRGDFVE